MFMTKIKSVLAVVLIVGLTLGGIRVVIGLVPNSTAVAQRPDGKTFVVGDEQTDGKKPVAGDKDKPKPDETTAKLLLKRISDDALVAEVLRRAVLADDKEKKEDGKKLLPGEIKRELNLGVVLRVKLVKLDTTAMLMTADVEPTKDVINPKTPLRMANLPLAVASVTDGKKELKLTDLKPGNILRLQLESWKTDGEAMAVTYVRVEDDGTAKKPDEKEQPKEDKK
jgi:hypothetical protein